MLGEFQWLKFKNKDTAQREEDEYEKWAFPYGDAQRRKIEELLSGLFPKERAAASLISFLTCKELFDSVYNRAEDYDEAIIALQKGIRRFSSIIRKKDAPLYAALAVADVKITPELEYPSSEELSAWAKEFSALPEPKKHFFER